MRTIGERSSRHRAPAVGALALALLGLLGATGPAAAGDLADVISDLYGGDGINLSQTSGFGHDAHFRTASLEGFDRLGEALASGIGTFSFSSVVTGFELDPASGVPVRVSDSLGPLLAENATTLGRGRINLGMTYARVEYSKFEGDDIDELSLIFDHPDVNNDGQLAPFRPFPGGPLLDFELDKVRIDIDLDLEQDIWAHFGTFGVTDRLDIGYIIPVIHTKAEAHAVASVVDGSPGTPSPHLFDSSAESPISHAGGSSTGLGDVIVRTKYDLADEPDKGLDLALGTQAVFPTGDEDDLMGTGELRAKAILISTAHFKRIYAHWNVGYEWVPMDHELNNLSAIVGMDTAFNTKVTGAVDVLGRWEHSGDGIGDTLIDLAVGAKFNVVDDIVLSANVQVPLEDDDGLRADVIWFVGIEGTF